MFFITCFDANWLENLRRMATGAPRDESGKMLYLRQHRRCFGYFAGKSRAIAAVERNEDDLQECLYSYCVVEELSEGIHPIPHELDGSNTTWFKWEDYSGRWVRIDQPEETRKSICFAPWLIHQSIFPESFI